MLKKQQKRHRRHKRVRAKISGTAEVPRLCVFRSSKHIYAQLINDDKDQILAAVMPRELKSKTGKDKNKDKKTKELFSGKIAIAYEVGRLIAKKGLEKKIEKAVFDRGGYKYHGRVKALADGARKEGLKF